MNILKKLHLLNFESCLIVSGVLITSIAKCMVIPFFAIYLIKNLNFNAEQAGLAIAARTWGQRGLILFGGQIVDRFGSKFTISAGLLLISVSYLFTAYVYSVVSIVFWTLILGLGGALYTPAIKSIMVKESSYEDRVFMLSLRSTALNIGSAIGPLIGMVIFIISPKAVFITTAIIILILAALSQLTLKISTLPNCNKIFSLKNILNIIKNIHTRDLCIYILFFTIFFIQLELTYPMFASMIFGDKTVAWMFVVNAIIIIIFQLPLSSFIATISTKKIFLYGMAILTIGMFLTSFSANSLIIFYCSIIFFSFGEILILPKIDAEISASVDQSITGAAFGTLGVASAIGAGIGGAVGGEIFHLYINHNTITNYWLFLTICSLVTIFVFAIVKNRT